MTSAMANALSVIPMCDLPHWSVSAMNAASETTKTNVLSAVVRVSQMHSTALSAHGWRKIEMDALRLSIWVVLERICSTKRKISGIISPLQAGRFPIFRVRDERHTARCWVEEN